MIIFLLNKYENYLIWLCSY